MVSLRSDWDFDVQQLGFAEAGIWALTAWCWFWVWLFFFFLLVLGFFGCGFFLGFGCCCCFYFSDGDFGLC